MIAEVPGVTPTAVGERLRLTRLAMGLGQQEFGRRAGISKSNMNNIERGRQALTLPNLAALCEAHDLNMEWVVAGTLRGLRNELVEAIRAQIAAQKAARKVAVAGSRRLLAAPDAEADGEAK